MPYAKLEPSGCGIHKGRAKLRIDLFMEEADPRYDRCYVNVPVIPPEGYQGKVDKEGTPKNQADYDAWIEHLPHIWQNNPFHSHKIWLPDAGASDNYINEQIERTLTYFYQFHQQMWDTNKKFIDEWKKVPKVKGSIRDIFVKGDPKDSLANQQKVADVLSRQADFWVGGRVPPTDLNIGEKGTIDVGSAAIDRESWTAFYYSEVAYTKIEYENSANATGTLDTVEIYLTYADEGNSLKVGTFTDNGGDNFTCHDAELIGETTPGYHSYTGLSFAITFGEYLGGDSRGTANLGPALALSGGAGGRYSATGQFCDPTDTTDYSFSSGKIMSLYGTGTESGGGETLYGQAILAGVGSTTILAKKISRGEVLFEGVGNLTAIGNAIAAQVTLYGQALLAGVGNLTVLGKRTLKGTTTLAGVGNLTASAKKILRGTAILAGVGNLTTVGKKVLRGVSVLAGVGTLTAVGKITKGGKVVLAGVGTLTATDYSKVIRKVISLSVKLHSRALSVALHGRSLITNLHNRSLSVKTRSKV